jgi:hypothetical protein
MTDHTRRTFVKSAGAATAALAGVPLTASADDDDGAENADGWTVAETPTGNTLHDVAYATDGAYAVGAGGLVLERTGRGWRKRLDGGPTGNGNSLYGLDVTDDGQRLWFVGSSGAIGEYDVRERTLYSHSAPMDVTNNFNGVAVTGEAGEANVYVAGDSGKIYYSLDNGATGTWDYVTPGSGSAVNAIDFHGPRSGHAVDGNKTVFVTDDGVTWEKLGIENANVNFYGVDSDGDDDVTVSAGGGMVHNWNGSSWIPQDTGDAGLRDVEADGVDALTVGGGGKVYRRDGAGWTQESTPTGQNLKAVTPVGSSVELAVGAGGIVLER